MKAWVVTLTSDSSKNFQETVIALLSARKTEEQVIGDLHLLYSCFRLLPSEMIPYIKYSNPDVLPVEKCGYRVFVGHVLQNHLTAYKANDVVIHSSEYPENVSFLVAEHKIYKQDNVSHAPTLQETIEEKSYTLKAIIPTIN